MRNIILLAAMLGVLSLNVQAKPTQPHAKSIVQNGMFCVESDGETLAYADPFNRSDGISLRLQAQKPTAKTGEEDIQWYLVIDFYKGSMQVVIKENLDFLALTLLDKTSLRLRPSTDVNGSRTSEVISSGSTSLRYFIHTIFYAVNPIQVKQIINTGVERIQLSYGSNAVSFDKSFKKDKIGEALKEMFSAVKSAIDEL